MLRGPICENTFILKDPGLVIWVGYTSLVDTDTAVITLIRVLTKSYIYTLFALISKLNHYFGTWILQVMLYT